MNNQRKKVLMVATSKKTKGGITAVLNTYKEFPFWEEFHVKWLETHADGIILTKLLFAIRAYLSTLFLVPQYAIIHIHLSEIPSLFRKIPIFLYSKLLNRKIIIHFHSFSPDSTINGSCKWLYRFVFKRADRVIVLSQSWQEWIKQYLRIDKNIVVIFNPCQKVNKTKSKNEKVVLYAGALNKRKGYVDLINAFASLAYKYPDWKLVVAGSGEIDNGRTLARKLKIENQILFPGWITGEEKDRLFSKASVFCLPSYAEGFPTAILDACSYGIPFITTPVGGIPDIVVDGENGLLFNPGDVEQLKEKLQLLIANEELRQNLGLAAKGLAYTVFGSEKINKDIESLYISLL